MWKADDKKPGTRDARRALAMAEKTSQEKMREDPMGIVGATIQIAHQEEPRSFVPVQVRVSTRSTYTAVPRKVLDRLGVPVTRVGEETLGDGTVRAVDLGDASVIVAGKEFTTTVRFAEEGEPSVLGVMALEQARVGVDPVNGRLIPV